MPITKPATSQPEDFSMLSFVPSGMARSVAEYLVAALPGAILLFAFFVAAEAAVFVGPNLNIAFLPVTCIVPLLSGVVSTLVLEKLRKKPLTFQRGALIGAAAGFVGAFTSALLLLIISFALPAKPPMGPGITGLVLYVALLAIVAIDTVISAVGGVIVIKFLKDI